MISLLLIILLMVGGLFILIKGADYLVHGAADFAKWLKVSPIFVGLTVVAFGTSLPEFVVSLFSVFNGSNDISIGNLVGSNIANIALVIGICSMITVLFVKSRTLYFEFPILLGATTLMLVLGYLGKSTFTRTSGIILLIGFALFIYYIYHSMKKDRKNNTEKHENSILKNSTLIIGGMLALVIGGRLFIYSATEIAQNIGISEAFIGLTMAAIGTSLPELVTSGIAAWKKKGDLAIGNIVGSNIFNILFVLGTVSVLKPISFSSRLLSIDGVIMLGITLLFTIFALTAKKINRWEGIVLLLIYIGYIVFLFVRL